MKEDTIKQIQKSREIYFRLIFSGINPNPLIDETNTDKLKRERTLASFKKLNEPEEDKVMPEDKPKWTWFSGKKKNSRKESKPTEIVNILDKTYTWFDDESPML